MDYVFDAHALQHLVAEVAFQGLNAEQHAWLEDQLRLLRQTGRRDGVYRTFSTIPRKVGKDLLEPTTRQYTTFSRLLPGFQPGPWTRDRWIRSWWLLQVDTRPKEAYLDILESMFRSADMAELECLYGCLPLFAYPESFRERCAEGIRNNMASVLDAVMLHNPYPQNYLDDPAWNQMVVKAFFTGKPIRSIQGLDHRNNAELARMLHDYAKERRAAGRSVPYLIWYLAAPFLHAGDVASIEVLLKSSDGIERQAGRLICRQSADPALQALEQAYTDISEASPDSWDAWMDQHHL